MKLRLAIAVALAAGIAPAPCLLSAQTGDPLRATHDALFASFIPIREVAAKPELVGAFTQAREGIWLAAGQAPAFRALVGAFTDLRIFAGPCGMAEVVKSSTSFAGLSPEERSRALYLLQSCSLNDARRLALGASFSEHDCNRYSAR